VVRVPSSVGLITVDRTSPVPLYFQVAKHLQRAIESGELLPGTQLDTESQLASQLGLSPPTLRRAVQFLVDKGLLVRKRGIGTQVATTKVKRPVELSSLWDDLTCGGQRPATTVLSCATEPASGPIAGKLGVAAGTPIVALDRLRYAGPEPLAQMRNYLPTAVAARLTGEALASQGLYQLLRSAGVVLHAAEQTIGARAATRAEAALLGEARGAPVLTMERITYDDRGDVVEYGTHLYRASRYSFQLSLIAG
jgi:DNA-binding GntR family transcriptional regulator